MEKEHYLCGTVGKIDHVAHSGNQTQDIWFMLPTRRASHLTEM